MTISRRFKIISGILLLVFLSIAVLFQYSTRSNLVLAEALQFRRMLVTRQSDGAYRFFFVTNRVVKNQDAPVEEKFSNERSEKLNFGFFNTSIEPSLGIGMLINPH